MDKSKKSVLVPIFFFSFFKFPITIKELRKYLWRHELTEDEIRGIIKQFPQINVQEDIVWYGDFGNKRKVNKEISDKFWMKIKRWRWIFANVPFLSQAFITSTLAYDNVNQNSDIDLFLIGKQGRLWTVRAFLLFWFNLFGLRVRSKDRSAKFSPELFISDKNLDIHYSALDQDNDYPLSFWLVDVISVWPNNSTNVFKQANYWLKEQLPIAYRSSKEKNLSEIKPSWFTVSLEKILSGKFGDQLEQKLYHRQAEIIKRNIKRLGVNPIVIINADMIKLHFNDGRTKVIDYIERHLNEFLAED